MDGIGLLRCICDQTRFAILEALRANGAMSVGKIAKSINKDQPLVSHHIKILKSCGIVAVCADGRRSICSISSAQISELISDILEASDQINAICSEDCCTAGCDDNAIDTKP